MVASETQLSRGAFFYLPLLSHNSIIDLASKRQSLGSTDAETCPLGLCLTNQIDLEAGVFAFTGQIKRCQEVTQLTYSQRKRRDEMFTQGMLWCAGCKHFDLIKNFLKSRPKSGPTNYGYRYHCKQCVKAEHQRRQDRQSQKSQERNVALKAQFVELAGGACHRCGYNAFNAALDFHHVYPSQKKYTPAYIIYTGNFEKAWREIDKCCLLCQNCHATYEASLWCVEFIKRDGLGWTIGADLPLDDKRYETDKPPAYNQASMPLFTYRQTSAQLGLF